MFVGHIIPSVSCFSSFNTRNLLTVRAFDGISVTILFILKNGVVPGRAILIRGHNLDFCW